ncbi:MAG: DUF448 domain-containing protein [Sphingosinicella sp.]
MRNPGHEALSESDANAGTVHVPERTCILSRRTAPRNALIRLALSPGGEVLPDVRARAPGRGAWIGVDRERVQAAQAKGKLRTALLRAFRVSELDIPEDLAGRIEAALQQGALDRLGLEARAGHLVTGSDRIEQAARAGKVHLLLHADDAAGDGSRRLEQALRVGSDGSAPPAMEIPCGRAILSLALGRENVVHAALVDGGAAARVSHWVGRWRSFLGNERVRTGHAPGVGMDVVSEGLE